MRRPSFNRLAVAAAVGALLGGTLIGAGTAQAVPSSCSSWYLYSSDGSKPIGGSMICNSGTGSFRVSVMCDKPWGFDYRAGSSWVPVGGGVATARCNSGHRAYDLWEEIIGPI